MIIENVYKITQFGYGDEARPTDMYIAAVRSEDLVDRAEIFRRTPDRRNGYQREISGSRLGKGKQGVAGYLLKQMGVFPTSILLNIRKEDGEVLFREKNRIATNIVVGELVVPDNLPWYAIDGQHRLEGLKIAMKEEEDLREYPVIITLTNEDILYEMMIFYIVNGRAKSVPTDLAYRLLQRMLYDVRAPKWIEQEILTGADRRKAIAAMIVDLLNTNTRSPFKGRIQEVGESAKPNHLTTDGTLARYVAEVLRDRIFSDMLDEEVANSLSNYWGAILDMYPNCFEKHDDYLLLSTLGLSSMMRLFPVVYGYSARDGDLSRKGMGKYLGYLLEETPNHPDSDFRRSISESWWHRIDGAGGIVKGTGEGHYKYVSDSLAKKLALLVKEKKEED